MPVLDSHTHVFPPELIAKRQVIASTDGSFRLIYGSGQARMADGPALFSYMEQEGIDRAVAACFPFEDEGLIRAANDYVLDLAKTDQRVIPFVTVDPRGGDGAVAEAERCLAQGARGVGELAYYEAGFGERQRMDLEGLATFMEQEGMVLMLHVNEQVGHDYSGKARIDFAEVVSLAQAHPGLKLILAHMGGGICFYEFMPEIRKAFSNVSYDLAAAPFLYSPELYAFAARFLTEKVLFGSDYPLLTLARYKADLESLGDLTRKKLLHDNARRLFGA
jgi:predicted TIM-barrel fold metal-dependent hydrolase